MPTNTEFANLWLYNDTNDKMKKFIDYRMHMAGNTDESNMVKIDKWLSTLNSGVSTLTIKVGEIISEDENGNITVDANTLDSKDSTYFENVAGTYNAICAYSDNVYTLTLIDTSLIILDDLFTLRFAAPNNYVDGSVFSFNGIVYEPSDPAFDESQVVLINFDKSKKKCYFSSGSGKGTADKIAIIAIPKLEGAENVQAALEKITDSLYATTTQLEELQEEIVENVNNIINGDTTVANANNSNLLEGKNLSYIMDYNNLTNLPVGGGSIISNTAPDVSLTSTLWVDTANGAVIKYSNGTTWKPVGSVWS